jgi:hypothetical protein
MITAGGTAALVALVTGTIAGGLTFGIVMAVMLGVQAAISAGFGISTDATVSGRTPCCTSAGQKAPTETIPEIIYRADANE